MSSISLVSLNIEGRKHLDLVSKFLDTQRPEVFCVQELCRQDVPHFESLLGTKGHFSPMHFSSDWDDELGVGIFTSLPGQVEEKYYAGSKDIGLSDHTSRQSLFDTSSYRLLVATLKKDGTEFVIGTLHLPVTENGETTDYQREALSGLFGVLDQYEDIVFCGDTNAPRGREIFSKISERYTDNIPKQYTTSIDGSIHRDGDIPFVVDGLFSTDGFKVKSAVYHCGVSDHCAIVATIEGK